MKNLREFFSEYPLGCDHFGAEWLDLWKELGPHVDKLGRLECYRDSRLVRTWGATSRLTIGELVAIAKHKDLEGEHRRIVLLSGAVIKEWGPK